MIGQIVRFILAGCGLWLAWTFASLLVLPATGSEMVAILASLGALAVYGSLIDILAALGRGLQRMLRPPAASRPDRLDSLAPRVLTTDHLFRSTNP